jgi:type III secretion protein R
MVINGLAIILTLFIMAPVGQDVFVLLKGRDLAKKDFQTMTQAADEAKAPLKEFLMKHSQRRERQFFMRTAKAIWPEGKAEDLKADDMIVLIPAFTVSELTTAFQIGFLLYLPFVAIDLIVSNIWLAMGMMMVSPMTISLPFKLLLFVLLDGWARLIHGLVLTYG